MSLRYYTAAACGFALCLCVACKPAEEPTPASEPAGNSGAEVAGTGADSNAQDNLEADAAKRVNDLADRYYAFRLEKLPEIPYFYGVEADRHDGLSDNSPAGIAEVERFDDELLEAISHVDPDILQGEPEWITYQFLNQALTSSRALRVCRNELWAVSQMEGWQILYPQLAEMQPVGTPELREQALARWRKLPAFIDQEILNLKAGLEAGYSSPKAAVERVSLQLEGLLAIPPDESPFASPAKRDEDATFKAAFLAIVVDEILPAVTRYRDFLRDDYLGKAREALAVTANPDGRDCYEASIRNWTTVERSGEDVFALGQKTVAANRERVIELGKAAYGLDQFTEIMEHIKNDAQDKFTSREELMTFSQDRVKAAELACKDWFGFVPTRKAEILPFPDYQEGTGVSARYEPGTETRPGVYRIPLFEPEKMAKGSMESTAFHEVWPGHHLQISIAQEVKGLHPITRITIYSGMAEGWGRYSEGLADEMGLYTTVTGPIARLAWPARGMVVDPGIHLFGWTREQAIAFMGEAGRMTDRELNDMVDRIAVMPGQLTSYDSGGLEIMALRRLAEEELGDSFDIKTFHDELLKNGSGPLTLLRAHIEAWLEKRLIQ